jgi:glycosyltransferase involved in cell wall biosynthesis
LKQSQVLFSHPTGNANVRAALKGLTDADLLDSFYTTIACFSGNTFDKLSVLKGLSEFNRRRFDDILKYYTETYPFKELGRLLSSKLGCKELIKHEQGIFSIDRVYNSLDKIVADNIKKDRKSDVKAVYAYEDCALFSFQEARKKHICCLYDLPIGYWRSARKLMAAEREKWPEWAVTLSGFNDSENKLARKDEELKLADHIFVASSFTAETLKEFPGKLASVSVIPYGFPPVGFVKEYSDIKKRPLKLLFVGGLSQRKGIADLFEAMKSFDNQIYLTIIGRKTGIECNALDMELKKCNWIPSMSHKDILNVMRENDVLIFPSLFEGFGLVISEAMSQGTPVITTNRTAGSDIIEHGKNGWIVEAGSSDSIVKMLKSILDNTDKVAQVGLAAMDSAKRRVWNNYGDELASTIKHIINPLNQI